MVLAVQEGPSKLEFAAEFSIEMKLLRGAQHLA